MVNFDLVIKRIEELKGVSGDKYVAAVLGISPQDFSNRKKRSSLLPVIFEWAINENVNLDWLIKGDEGKKPEKPANAVVEKIGTMLNAMDKEAQQDVLKYAEKAKLLGDLLAERQNKKAA